MRGLTRLERRALIVDPSAEGEEIPDYVFINLIAQGRAIEGQFTFDATEMGLKALRVCPIEHGA